MLNLAGLGLTIASIGTPQEFPPLPKRTDSAVHSRVASLQSGHASRPGTPKIPPGFERTPTPKIPPGFGAQGTKLKAPPGLEHLHARPAPAEDTSQRSSPKKEWHPSAVTPIVPAMPTRSPVRNSSLKQEPKVEDVSSATAADDQRSQNVEGTKTRQDLPAEMTVRAVQKTAETQSKADVPSEKPALPSESENAVAVETREVLSTKDKSKGHAAYDNAEQGKSVEDEPRSDAAGKQPEEVPPVSAGASKPNAVHTDQTSGAPELSSSPSTSPLKKQAKAKRPTLRTLQITSEMIARSESQAPPSTTTERSAAFPTLSHIRQGSCQPSISTSRPSTPAASDRFASQDVSRAGSPPPSMVGSALSRNKTKAQAKKERRKKATEMSESGSTAAAPTPPAQEDVAPIVARQKKQKKAKASSTASAGESSKASKGTRKEEEREDIPEKQVGAGKAESQPPSPVTKTQPPEEPIKEPLSKAPMPPPPALEPEQPRPSYTLRDFYTDAARVEAKYHSSDLSTSSDEKERRRELQGLLADHISPLPQLLSEMIAAGDITRDHPFFAAPPLNSSAYRLPADHRKGQAYLDGNGYTSSDSFGMVYLPNKEKKALYHGHAVSVADSGDRNDDLLKRCLITPSGWVLRHLSREESEKVLDLEERRGLYVEEYGDLGRMDGLGRLEDDDYCNLEGGFEELSRYGENHGICWIMGNDPANARRRFARRSGNGLDDDYGLGEMPIDPNAEIDADQFDDLDDEDDEEELDGEQMVLGAEVEFDDDHQFEAEGDDGDLTFADVSAHGETLPPLPEMMNTVAMPGGWDPEFNAAYPTRTTQHGMYSSLNTPSAMAYPPPDPSDLDLPSPPPLPPTSQFPPSGTRGNTLPPMRHSQTQGLVRDSVFSLRAMDIDLLEKAVKDRAKELETAKKEAEKLEKMVSKKNKDAGKWKDVTMKAAGLAV